MAKITITDEQEFRAALVADLDAIALAGNVFNRRRSFNSRKDFIERCGIEVNEETEIRFMEVELIAIEDDETEGPDDCPVANLTYNLHAFHQFADARKIAGVWDETSYSEKDFIDLILRLRTFFLDKRTYILTNWNVQTDPITPPEGSEFLQFGSDTFTDVRGHFADRGFKAYFYDKDD